MLVEIVLRSLLLGVTIGLTPGPILFVTINETLDKGPTRGGLFVLIGMLLTDMLIIIPSTFIASLFFQDSMVQIFIGLLGGSFLIILGFLTLKSALLSSKGILRESDKVHFDGSEYNPERIESSTRDTFFSEASRSFSKTIMTQMLNPLAYIFWITVVTVFVFSERIWTLSSFLCIYWTYWILNV